MIFDILENIGCYESLNKGFAEALVFLMRNDLKELPPDRYDIDGDRVYAIVAKGPGRKKEDAMLETHEKYIDIQLVLAGIEEMGWSPKSSCVRQEGEYDSQKDLQFFADKPEVWFSARSGVFAIFFPEDAHMPMIAEGEVHKIVVKVAMDQG